MQLRALDPLLYPVEHDIIHTESQFIPNFYQLITQSIQPPYSVSIDGLWGTGKTTVMKMLEEQLEESGYPVFWFNPWEYRQTESVVLAFLQCIAEKHTKILSEIKKSGTTMLRVLLESGMDVGLKLISKNNLSLKALKESFDDNKKKSTVDEFKNTIEAVKKEFKELVNQVSKQHDDKPVIIFWMTSIAACLTMPSNCWKP